MVYKIFNDSRDGTIGRKPGGNINVPQLHIRTESFIANLLIRSIKFLLLIYDIISLPIYFVIQRPDRRAKEAQRTRSERVDINTWIKTDLEPNKPSHLCNTDRQDSSNTKRGQRSCGYMGATLGEIFANSVREFSSRACLGYRAVVTCPVLTQNEEGQPVLQEKSFRSDYTWYTYEQVGRRVQDIASGLYYHSLLPSSKVLFLANTSLEWFCASQACFQLAAQLVVAPEVDDESSLCSILKESEVETLFTSCDRINQLCRLFDTIRLEGGSFRLKMIVLIDWQFTVDYSEPIFAKLRDSCEGIVDKMLSISQIEEVGVENPVELFCSKLLGQDNLGSLDQVCNGTELVHRTCKTTVLTADSPPATSALSVPLRRRSIAPANSRSSGEKRRLFGSQRFKFESGEIDCNELRGMNFSSRRSFDYTEAFNLGGKNVAQPNDLAMIVYTHGSLGQIKAVMLTHGYLARSNHYLFLDGMVQGGDIHCTTLSLDSVIEFMTETCVFSRGGSIGYSCNPNTLFFDGKDLFKRDLSDLEALNPTFLLSRPYILERLRVSIQNYLSLQSNPLISFILTYVLFEYKKYWARKHFGTPIVDKIFCSRLTKLFGTNLKCILCNGATDCSETKDFFAFMVNLPVIELYGPDEAVVSLISVNDSWDYKRRFDADRFKVGRKWRDDSEEDGQEDFANMQLMPPKVNRNIFKEDNSKNLLSTSSVLCPTLGTRIRLEDWEDFKASDRPYPRGRMVIGGDVVSKGYYKRQRQTNESFYVDSNFITWFRTNDIARVFPNGSFEIISAMSDMIKMVDGQFISLSQIEHILRNSQFVDNVCAICGDDRRVVIALVVPNLRRLALKSPGEANLKMAIGPEPEPEELIDVEFRREVCNDRLLSEFVSGHLSELIAKAGLHSIPSRFHLVPEIWTPETELVTPSFEPKRNAIQKFYAADIQSILKMDFSLSAKRLSARFSKTRNSCRPNGKGLQAESRVSS